MDPIVSCTATPPAPTLALRVRCLSHVSATAHLWAAGACQDSPSLRVRLDPSWRVSRAVSLPADTIVLGHERVIYLGNGQWEPLADTRTTRAHGELVGVPSLVKEDGGVEDEIGYARNGGLAIDSEWSVWEERGFTWWGHRQAQRVWSEPGHDDDGFVVYRLHAQADVVRDLDITEEVLGKINALNTMCVTSALVADREAGSIGYAASAWVHEETLEWVCKLFQFVVAIQAAHANAQGELLAGVIGGEPAVSAHPQSGARAAPDDMLGLMEQIVVPIGQEPSRWCGPEMGAFVELEKRGPFVVFASGDDEGLTAEFPFLDRTALLQAETQQPHPSLGSGMLVRLSLPEHVDEDGGGAWASEMNQQELGSLTRSHFLGSWVVADGTPTFVTFYPNAVKVMQGDIQSLLMSAGLRAKWVAEDLRGDDWRRPGRLEEARKRKLAELERFSSE
jgi:hypothetical protein